MDPFGLPEALRGPLPVNRLNDLDIFAPGTWRAERGVYGIPDDLPLLFYREYKPYRPRPPDDQPPEWAGFGVDCLATPAAPDEPAAAPTCALYSKPPRRRTLLTPREDFLLLATETPPQERGYQLLTTLLVWRYRVWLHESTPYLQLLWHPQRGAIPSMQYATEGSVRHRYTLQRGWTLITTLRGAGRPEGSQRPRRKAELMVGGVRMTRGVFATRVLLIMVHLSYEGREQTQEAVAEQLGVTLRTFQRLLSPDGFDLPWKDLPRR